MSKIDEEVDLKKALFDFAIAVQREVAIRSRAFLPATNEEKDWATEGLVPPEKLSSISKIAS